MANIILVDNCDLFWLNKINWKVLNTGKSKRAFACLYIDGKKKILYMHRLLLKCPKGMVVDHIDHNGLNNQKSNLRICTYSENSKNKTASGFSKYLGVTKQDHIQKHKLKDGYKTYNYGKTWKASILNDKKHIHLGLFPFTKQGEIDAAKAYNEAAIKYHKQFANLNKI